MHTEQTDPDPYTILEPFSPFLIYKTSFSCCLIYFSMPIIVSIKSESGSYIVLNIKPGFCFIRITITSEIHDKRR